MRNFGNHLDLQRLASSSPLSVMSHRTEDDRDRRSQLVREERYQREMGECSFQPQINDKSQQIVHQKRLKEALEAQRLLEMENKTPTRVQMHGASSTSDRSPILPSDLDDHDNGVEDDAAVRSGSPKNSGFNKSKELYEHARLLQARRGEYEKLMEQAHSFSFKTSLKKQRRASVQRRKDSSRDSFFERMHRAGAERAQRIGTSVLSAFHSSFASTHI